MWLTLDTGRHRQTQTDRRRRTETVRQTQSDRHRQTDTDRQTQITLGLDISYTDLIGDTLCIKRRCNDLSFYRIPLGTLESSGPRRSPLSLIFNNILLGYLLFLPTTPLHRSSLHLEQRGGASGLLIGHMTPNHKKASYVTALGWAPRTGYLGTLNLKLPFVTRS